MKSAFYIVSEPYKREKKGDLSNMINKDELYILKQPEKSTLSLVVIDSFGDYPLSKEIHDNLEKLLEYSDIIFIFLDCSRKLNREKFTTLYSACGFIECKDNLGITTFKALDYAIEIFKIHAGFLIFDILDFDNKYFKFDLLRTLGMIGVEKPILEVEKLSPEELFKIYNEGNLFKRKKESNNKYCSYYSPSKTPYFPKSSVIKILGLSSVEFIKSFDGDYMRLSYLLPSFLKYFEIDYIDSGIEYLELKKEET